MLWLCVVMIVYCYDFVLLWFCIVMMIDIIRRTERNKQWEWEVDGDDEWEVEVVG